MIKIVLSLSAQGPRPSYFYNPQTELSFASCFIYSHGGSKSKIPFMPMVSDKRAPLGTEKYTKDIDVDVPIVFVGNGIVKENVYDSYSNIEAKGKAVMFSFDFPDTVNAAIERSVSMRQRIEVAVSKGASCIILFSMQNEFPLIKYPSKNSSEIPEIPIILINQTSARTIISATGYEPEQIFENWKKNGVVESMNLVSNFSLKVKGKFDRIETENFSFSYRENLISKSELEKLIEINEKSLGFILDLLEDEELKWEKSFVAYFRDFDSKVFYVNHWGYGLANTAGTFMVYDGELIDYGLAVHENMHRLLDNNWGESSSFLSEAFGMYAESKATDEHANHKQVIEFLGNGKLPHLEKMVNIDVGGDPLTNYAYPASGSFIDFLIKKFGIRKVKEVYMMEYQKNENNKDSWNVVFDNFLTELEVSWLNWLQKEYGLDETAIQLHLQRL